MPDEPAPASAPKPHPPRVVVLGLGGTIAMTGDSSGGVVPDLSAEQIVAAVPGLDATRIAVEVVDLMREPSGSLSFGDLDDVARAVDAAMEGGANGVVVVQGTDTIEETAYLLDLDHRRARPVVVTGAMRSPGAAGADGAANLLAAVQVAASQVARGSGVLVVLADEIHAAARVRKTHTTSGATFQSPDGGPLGYVVEGRARIVNRSTWRLTLPPLEGPAGAVEVAVVPMTLGDTGVTLDALAGRVDGMVIAGFGAGHVPVTMVEALDEIASRIPVVLSSRSNGGSVLARTYAFPGSESDVLARGMVSAGFLDPLKSRILLRRLLLAGSDDARIRAAVAQAGGYAEAVDLPAGRSGQ